MLELVYKFERCQFCEQDIPSSKMYCATLEWTGDHTTSKYAHGHKYCMMSVQGIYKKYGRIVTEKDLQNESFDASI